MNPNLRKNIVSLLLTALIIGGAIILSKQLASQKASTVSGKAPKKERRKVTTQQFSSNSEANSISIDGRLQAHDRVGITSKVQGILQDNGKSLRAGRFFTAGEPLFVIDSQEASYSLKAQRASLLTSITQMMPDLKFDYPQSFSSWDHYLKGLDIEKSIKPLPTPINEQEKFFIAGRNIYNQYYHIKSLESRLGDYTIFSPFSGILTQVNAFPGAMVSPGQSLAMMINTATYELIAPVALKNLKYVNPGQTVKLTSEELGKSWNGKVSRIGSLIDQATQNLPIYVSVAGSGLKDGMYLKGNIGGKAISDVYKIPKSAFVSPTSVYIVQDSTLVTKEIESVKRLEDDILVTGLSADDQIVISTLSGLFEGQKVNY